MCYTCRFPTSATAHVTCMRRPCLRALYMSGHVCSFYVQHVCLRVLWPLTRLVRDRFSFCTRVHADLQVFTHLQHVRGAGSVHAWRAHSPWVPASHVCNGHPREFTEIWVRNPHACVMCVACSTQTQTLVNSCGRLTPMHVSRVLYHMPHPCDVERVCVPCLCVPLVRTAPHTYAFAAHVCA